MKKKLFLGIMFILMLVVSVAAAPPAQVTAGEEYVVQANDWLSKLALKYYGDMFAYDKIVDATNAKAAEDASFAVIDNPDLIEVGQKLWIPAAEMVSTGDTFNIAALRNAQYGGMDGSFAIQLTDGHYEGNPFAEDGTSRPMADFVDNVYTFGDLNSDGVDDAAVFLVENDGGSGEFVSVAPVLNENGVPVNAGMASLGDRISLISVKIDNGVIAVDMVTQGPDDPMCCATLEVVRSFELQDGKLVELPQKEIGTIGAARLAQTPWMLVGFDNPIDPTPVLPDTEITLTVDMAAGKIGGSAGCNNYFGSFTEDARGSLSVEPIGATMMACAEDVMAQEQKFLSALQSLHGFQFWNGQLLLNTGEGMLILSPQK